MSTTVNGSATPIAPQQVDHVMTVLREQVLALCAQCSRPPSAVRVSVRDVTLEVEWSGAVPAAPDMETVPAGTVTAVAAPGTPAAGAGNPAAATVTVNAATVGTFYRAPEPNAEPFVSAGDVVRPGQQVGIVEAMKLMIPVESDRAGRVVEILVDNGEPVEHGQPLLTLEPVS